MVNRPQFAAALALVTMLLAACSPAISPAPVTGQPTAPTAGASSTAGATLQPTDRLRLVIDTDMAPDDVVAIASLLRDPSVEVLAITVTGTGEAHCPGGMFVARAIVTILREAPIPVTCGNRSPLAAAEEFPSEWRTGADTGNGLALVSPAFAPDARQAPELLAELAAADAARGARLTILTLGTMTNIATALEVDPDMPSKVRLVSMLGAISVPGNVMGDGSIPPTAEWNAHADPTAVRRVLEAGFDWTLVPLDATNSVPLTPELFDQLASNHAAGPADLVFELWARNPYMTQSGFYLWDPLASVVVREPGVMMTREAKLSVVEGDGPNGGRLVEDPTGHPVLVGTSADRSRFETVLLERLRLGAPRANAFTEVGSLALIGGDGSCLATFDPTPLPAGLLRIRVTNAGTLPMGVVVFELAALTWTEIEAFVANFDPTAVPAVTVIAQLETDPGATTASYGTSPAGTLGVVCFTGPFDAPTLQLAGPFPIGP